jgi:pilus assembly protein CpaE
MSGSLRISICDPNETSREVLKKYLIGMDKIFLEADCSRYEFFTEIVAQTTPHVAIIDIDSDQEAGLRLVESLARQHPSSGVIVISASTDGQVILKAMRSGAREFLNSPVEIEELVGALDRVGSSGEGGASSKAGTTIAVAGSSGGVGTTSIAVNTAVALAQNPENSVALVDLDLALGDADVFLDMIPEYTLLDVTQSISRLDLALLRKSLTKHETGVYLLPRPIQIEETDSISSADFKKVLSLLKASFTHVVLDLSKCYTELDCAAIETAEHVLLVTQLDLPCLRNVVRILNSIERFDNSREAVKIIVNRAGLDGTQISSTKAEETIDREIFARIPNNYVVISECRNNGVPLLQQAPKASITHAIGELAIKLSGGVAENAAEDQGDRSDKKGWLPFLKK